MDVTLERILSLIPKKADGKFVHGSKKEFAESIGYDSGDVVSMWEKGTSVSYRNKLHEIAAKYNVSVEWLKGETDEKRPVLKEDEQQISDLLDRMDRAQLLGIIARATEILKDK